MGCGSSKSGTASEAKQAPAAPKPVVQASAAPPANAKPAAPPAEDPSTQPEDPAAEHDPLLARELNAKKIDKSGKEVDPYDRKDNRPEDNAAFGMFQIESAGQGDQALAVKPWVGQVGPPDNAPAFRNDAPNINLTLEYIYGYRCFDTRQNIFYTKNPNEIVYMAAAVGITLNTTTNQQKFMGAGDNSQAKGHSDDITALAIHPDRTLVATGEVGKNPKIIVWSVANMQPVNEFRQGRNSRGVTALAFNKDGTLLASTALDNEHTVRVWDWKTGSQKTEQSGGPDKILDAAFSTTDNTLLTVGIKHVYFWNGAANWDKKRGVFGQNGKMCNLTSAQYLNNGTAVTGGTNGYVYLWNGNQCAKSVAIHGSHAVHTLRVIDDLIYSGGSDKKLNVLDANLAVKSTHTLPDVPRAVDKSGNNLIVGCINGDIIEIAGTAQKKVMESHSEGEVWGLAVNPSNPNVIASVGDDNKVKTWDTSAKKPVKTGVLNASAGPKNKPGYGASTMADTAPNQQARSIAINPKNGNIAIGYNDGSWQIRAGIDNPDTKLHEGKEPKEWIEALRFSPDGAKLAIGSHDNFIYIVCASTWALLDKIQKHSSYITSLDWSKGSDALHSTDGAYELLFWSVDGNGRIKQEPDGRTRFKNEEWDTFSTHFGWPVQGIFGGVIDYTHVNRVDRSPDGQFFAVGNDWGLIEIFNNPNGEGAKSKQFRGHSEHVTNVKWTNTHVFSAGGYDQCIMQWRRG